MNFRPAPSGKTVPFLMLGILFTGFVIIVVNFQIYQARYLYIAAHPELTAIKPPTISGALRDPAIGAPFAVWISISAVLLIIGVASMVWSVYAEALRAPRLEKKEQRLLMVLSLICVTLQLMACIGMVILSNFRFPDYNAEHMFGSYLFFFSQAFVVVFVEISARRFFRQADPHPILSPYMMVIRRRFVWVTVALGLAYLTLFLVKNYDLGVLSKPIFTAYVTTEPLLISSFLFYNLLFHGDMWNALLRYRRERSSAISI